MNLVQLKQYNEMQEALEKVLQDGFREVKEELLSRAGKSLLPIGVCTLYMQAIYVQTEGMQDVQQPFTGVLLMIASNVFEAIVDGNATQVVEEWNTMMQITKELNPEPEPVPTASMDFAYFEAIQMVGHIIHEAAEQAGYWSEERRDDGVNPYYNQLEAGCVVEFYYSHPHKIHTPLGEWSVTGSGMGNGDESDAYLKAFLNHPDLEIKLHKPEVVSRMGQFGPWYVVRRVGNLELPEPVERPSDEFVEYQDADKLWDALTQRYLSRHVDLENPYLLVKAYPESDAARQYADQRVFVKSINPDGTASITPPEIFEQKGGVLPAIPLTDFYLYSENRVRK